MRCFVSLGIYRASGALFRTMDTVDAEYPLLRATSRIVTTALFGMVSFLNLLRGMPWHRQAMFWSNEDSVGSLSRRQPFLYCVPGLGANSVTARHSLFFPSHPISTE
jgi:hypothetical protein